MDAIKIFDEKFKEKNSYYALGCKIVKYIGILFSLFILATFPYYDDDNKFVDIYLVLSLMYPTIMHLSPYLYMKQGKSTIPYFKLMKDTPISRKAFINSRISILVNFIIKYAIACIITIVLSNIYLADVFLFKNLITSIISIIFYMLLLTLICIKDIYSQSNY